MDGKAERNIIYIARTMALPNRDVRSSAKIEAVARMPRYHRTGSVVPRVHTAEPGDPLRSTHGFCRKIYIMLFLGR